MSECYHLSHFFKTVLIEIFKKGIHSDTRTSFILMNELQAFDLFLWTGLLTV